MSMPVLNVLSKHFRGLPCLPLRMVLTVADRASCAGVSAGSDQGGVVWIDVCLMRGVWTVSVCTMPHCVRALAGEVGVHM